MDVIVIYYIYVRDSKYGNFYYFIVVLLNWLGVLDGWFYNIRVSFLV